MKTKDGDTMEVFVDPSYNIPYRVDSGLVREGFLIYFKKENGVWTETDSIEGEPTYKGLLPWDYEFDRRNPSVMNVIWWIRWRKKRDNGIHGQKTFRLTRG